MTSKIQGMLQTGPRLWDGCPGLAQGSFPHSTDAVGEKTDPTPQYFPETLQCTPKSLMVRQPYRGDATRSFTDLDTDRVLHSDFQTKQTKLFS